MSGTKSWWQFSLKTFVLITLFAVLAIAWWVERQKALRHQAEALRQSAKAEKQIGETIVWKMKYGEIQRSSKAFAQSLYAKLRESDRKLQELQEQVQKLQAEIDHPGAKLQSAEP